MKCRLSPGLVVFHEERLLRPFQGIDTFIELSEQLRPAAGVVEPLLSWDTRLEALYQSMIKDSVQALLNAGKPASDVAVIIKALRTAMYSAVDVLLIIERLQVAHDQLVEERRVGAEIN
jgi:hypothetical protein